MSETLQRSQIIASTAELEAYFQAAATPRERWLVGVEQEKVAVRSNGAPVPYYGADGIAQLLERLLGGAGGWQPIKEGAHLIGLSRAHEQVTLEPGMQVELSGPALGSALACREVTRRHVDEVAAVGRALDIRFIAGGFRPFGRLEEIAWLPKRRYDIMREYLPRHGTLGHEMMKRTATVQVNLDFADEADAVAKIRTAQGVTSIVTAMMAASPITEGQPNGYQSYRAAVWLDMDESRCGLLPFAFAPDFGFRHYVDWALDVPMFFVAHAGQYHPVEGLTFRRFLRDGWNGERATMADWQLHLSTLFPEVRLKRTIELRGADAAPAPLSDGLAALWRGLLDEPEARAAAWALVAHATLAERQALRREVPLAGLRARLGQRPIAPLALELCAIAAAGLARLREGENDRALLEPLRDFAQRGRTAADDMLAELRRLGGDPARLVDAWELSQAR
jgi:glutamate--cysteine ligase